MVNKEINQLLDNYIEKRRGLKQEKVSDALKKKTKYKEEEKVPKVNSSSIYVIKKPKSFWEKLKEHILGIDDENFEEKKTESSKVKSVQEFEQQEDEIEHEEKKLSFFGRIMNFFTANVDEEYQDMDDEDKMEQNEKLEKENKIKEIEDDEMPKKKSFFTRMLARCGILIEEVDDENEEEKIAKAAEKLQNEEKIKKAEEIRNDLKQVAEISLNVIKKLPKDELRAFKASKEFSTFKEILKKHNIIK